MASTSSPGSLRAEFHLPCDEQGEPLIYFCGNSLGPQPREASSILEQEMASWANLAVEGHFEGSHPWYTWQENVRESMARLVGALPSEVILMNTLTINLHCMMATFYRPTNERHKILIESPTFPSDLYAVQSQIRLHGYDPHESVLTWAPPEGEHLLHLDDLEQILKAQGEAVALVLINPVNFLTGQFLDVERISKLAREQGCHVGLDLAHAVGNVELALHDWDIDFAVWCNYKYVCAGPGAVAGCFVHQRHGESPELFRLAGWWGNDPEARFLMQLQPKFVPKSGADGWQVSNPPMLSLAPLWASLNLFDRVGMQSLRELSRELTECLEEGLRQISAPGFEIITPTDSHQRGSQLSLAFVEDPKEKLRLLREQNVVCDFREPNVIRLAPAPMYNTLEEVMRFVSTVAGF